MAAAPRAAHTFKINVVIVCHIQEMVADLGIDLHLLPVANVKHNACCIPHSSSNTQVPVSIM